MGFVLGFGLMVAGSWIFQRKSPRQVDKLFRRLQLLSAAAYSLGHGGNDAQKTMGIVAGAPYTAGVMSKADFTANWETGTGQSFLPPTPPSLSAPISAVGGLFTRWDRKSPS